MAPSNLLSAMTQLSQLLCLLLLFIPLVLLLLLKQVGKREGGKEAPPKLPPGPWRLPIIGNLHQLGSSPHHSFHKLSVEHGPLMLLKLGSVPTLIISSSDMAREITKAHDLEFSGRPVLYAARKIFYGGRDMAFAPYGEYWRQVRKVSMLELLSMKRVQAFQGVREEEVASLVASISRSSSLAPINLSAMLLSLANNITCRIAFGNKYGGGEYDQGGSRFEKLLKETQNLIGGFCLADFFPQFEWIEKFTGLEARLEKNFKELDSFYNKVIEEHLSTAWPEPEHEDFVHVLLRLRKDPAYDVIFSSMDHIKGLITDIFIAGTDTSSATLVWAMTELIRNPRVMARAQEEVRTIIGNDGKVEERNLQRLNYLKLVIKEVFRLHPPAPLLVPRETTKKCIIDGFDIPKKIRVFINAQSIGRDSKSWTEPEKFWPERFIGNNIDFRGQDFTLIPFGAGRRICPGIHFATAVIELAFANLLYHFDWGLPYGMKIEDLDMEEAFGMTMHKKKPLYLAANPK